MRLPTLLLFAIPGEGKEKKGRGGGGRKKNDAAIRGACHFPHYSLPSIHLTLHNDKEEKSKEGTRDEIGRSLVAGGPSCGGMLHGRKGKKKIEEKGRGKKKEGNEESGKRPSSLFDLHLIKGRKRREEGGKQRSPPGSLPLQWI